MKKTFTILVVFVITIVSYYFLSFYPYTSKISSQLKVVNVDKSRLKILQELIVSEKNKNLESMKSNVSVEHLLRIQTFMTLYNRNVLNKDKNKYFWRFDRLFWSYLSYIDFSDEDIIRLYLSTKVYPKNQNIVQYSKSFLKKDINSLNNKELKTLYEIGH